jgi:hypothetical protein
MEVPMRDKLLSMGYKDADYIGDGVYVANDGYQIWLMCLDGFQILEKIALDDKVQAALVRYMRLFEEAQREGRDVYPHHNVKGG